MNGSRTWIPDLLADYGFERSLAASCAGCGAGDGEAVARDGYSLLRYLAPISERCPVATFVGVCRACLRKYDPRGRWDRPALLRDGCRCPWSPPPLIRPVAGEPLYVVPFGHADDGRLAGVVGGVWRGLPADARASMRQHLTPRIETGARDMIRRLNKGALRVEALRAFPGSRRNFGQCLHGGHTVRLSAPKVNPMPDPVLATLVAHELAHVYQHARRYQWAATGLPNDPPDEEDDARRLMADWGFRDANIDDWDTDRRMERWEARMRRSERPADGRG